MIHHPGCECEAYACRLRRKGLQVSTAALPSQHNRKPTRRNTGQAWNAQLVYEDRPGGFKMPIYNPETGSQMRIKQYTEQEHKIKDNLARMRAGHTT